MTGFQLVALLTCAALLFGWALSAWANTDLTEQLDQAREDCAKARRDRDEALWDCGNAVNQLANLLVPDDTIRLPHWTEFLDTQAAHDNAVIDLMEQQFRDSAGGGSR